MDICKKADAEEKVRLKQSIYYKNKISVKSPAKLNLYLKIISKLPDNYHELSTRFQLIDIYDDLSFSNTESNHISVICSDNSIKEENNIVYKTAILMQKINNGGGVKIELNKAIPTGAGLGGGSSNAASTIILLNKLWEMNLNLRQMKDIGRDIGADVPFFIIGRNACATGVGDIFEEIDSDKSNYIVIHPRIFNSTKAMFDKYDAANLDKKNMGIDKQNSFWSIFLNDNEQVKIFYEQNIKKYKICLSGSGSSMFIKYNDELEKEKILKIIPSNWRFFEAKPLQYSPLEEFV